MHGRLVDNADVQKPRSLSHSPTIAGVLRVEGKMGKNRLSVVNRLLQTFDQRTPCYAWKI